MVDTTALMTINSQSFIEPVPQGHEFINVTDVCFLIEHEPSDQKVMFDLGVRTDYWNFPPTIQKRLGDVIPSLKVDQDVSDVLIANSVPLSSINSLIWSHHHWDHTGNPALFPPTTSLTVGPGLTTAEHFPGFPKLPKSPLLESDFQNRTVNEINTFPLTISGVPAHDFFGDGSFYLLDTPGHCIGHICGLARTSTNPDTFVYMGGDICHFAGDFRPSAAKPLPDPIPEGVLDRVPHFPSPCPAEVFTSNHPRTDQTSAPTTPWYKITSHPRAAYINPPQARETLQKMQPFDDNPHVLVCLAHDTTMLKVLPTLNSQPDRDLNDWFARGWKEQCHWGWLNELPRKGERGRELVVQGFWREGKRWDYEGWKRGEREKGRL
jgi:glyoxylase-like metal-dependent hydrolase (beta-lactamase superfamily II)